jgi:hypothetical protein
MILKESEIRKIIETYVREYLTEEENNSNIEKRSQISNIRASLKANGLKQADIARHLIKTVWTGQSEDTARSHLSQIARGVLNPNPQEVTEILKGLSVISAEVKV